jgi:hypothetical protein
MARKVSWGTPRRSEHYVFPRAKYGFVRPWLAIAGGLLALVMVLYAVGVRSPVSPGAVIGAHGTVETSCQACHTTAKGAANIRCQRCHDPATAGRLDNRVHVLFGSGDVKKASAAPALECATCHIEHRGRTARLADVNQLQCTACHFRSFGAHPEFAVLRSENRELPGMRFGHGPATASFKGHVAEVMEKKHLSLAEACATCHEAGGRDFQPISFDRHCAECHTKALVATVGVPAADVLSPSAFVSAGLARQAISEAEFETARGKLSKTVVRHKDDWIMVNARRLRRELEPDAYTTERAALQARLSRLRRRLALAMPLASLTDDDLKDREAALARELDGITRRLETGPSGTPGARVDEVASALQALADPALKAEAASLKGAAGAAAGPITPKEFDARRQQVLALLDAVDAADPALKARTDDLRRRLLSLVPGDTTRDVLSRVRDQREAERMRLADERTLRASGALPPAFSLLVGEQRALQTAIADVESQLARMEEGPPVATSLTAEDRDRKRESLDSLLQSCVKCHVLQGAAVAPVRAARPVLVRSRFVHQPHLLQADCTRCHKGIEASKAASDLNFTGVVSCRECHTGRAARQDCLSCHRYHPPAVP